MHILISSATGADAAYFSQALGDHQIAILEAPIAGAHPEAEAIAVVHGTAFGQQEMDWLPKLKLIVTRSTGFDHVDREEAKRRGIAVCNVPEYGSVTVAEFTMGLILSLSRNIPQAVASTGRGEFSVRGLMGTDLDSKTLGIIGLGKIGRNLAKMAGGFGMNVVFHDIYKEGSIPLDVLLAASDVVALCCPLTPQTRHLIDAKALALMKETAFLVNTARGPIVDSEALLASLDANQLAGAALDVLEDEEQMPHRPTPANQALIAHPKVLVTPHLAYDSAEAVGRIRETTAAVLIAFANGTVMNQV